ncbi:hypothetical protein [Streptomyces parvulus]|uniref:hypothetical protein n=1 Tax=Streptomyces parvulus TaxID=146923 RepID=UPI0036E59473
MYKSPACGTGHHDRALIRLAYRCIGPPSRAVCQPSSSEEPPLTLLASDATDATDAIVRIGPNQFVMAVVGVEHAQLDGNGKPIDDPNAPIKRASTG